MPWIGTWEGGRIWQDKDGRRTYVIHRRVAGRRYAISTRSSSYKAALQHLQRFEADPEGYCANGLKKDEQRLVLDDVMVDDFIAFSRDEKRNTAEWVTKQRGYLRWWQERLRNRDLRRLSLRDDLTPALAGASARRQKIEVIKALCSWLRTKGRMGIAQDATVSLHVGPIRPEQWRRPKAVPQADLEKVKRHLRQPWHDLLTVLTGTGIHLTELYRFCTAGEVAQLPPVQRTDGAAAVLVIPRHKLGHTHRIAISQTVAEAAQRQRDRGGFSKINFYRAIQRACDEAKVPRFAPGQMRHTVATRAVEAGADPATVAAFLGHRSASTTQRFYSTLAVLPKPVGIA
ncbi:MAG TPA: tyrosine-type recombinase/integrase [Anaeromyxobacteraceae bacterium]|nr:tyrosine-type recombinase/integrase [Anaeromyxobacteraceae bacterium]